MLPTSHRLTKEQDFARVKKYGKPFFSSLFRVAVRPTKNTVNRFAVVVSTRINKKAVIRNRLRRQVREIIRQSLPALSSSYDVVVTARSNPTGISSHLLQKDLTSLFKKAKLLPWIIFWIIFL